jgi:hypothetical protein
MDVLTVGDEFVADDSQLFDRNIGKGDTQTIPLRDPEVAGGCNVSGCLCAGMMGYGDICENCGHNGNFHW